MSNLQRQILDLLVPDDEFQEAWPSSGELRARNVARMMRVVLLNWRSPWASRAFRQASVARGRLESDPAGFQPK